MSRTSRGAEDASGFVKIPVAPVHAKRFGTTVTLCGQICTSWDVHLDRLFQDADAEVCGACHRQAAGE